MFWSPQDVMRFIEIYRSKEILWDPTYSNVIVHKVAKANAWTEISNEMGYSVHDLKKKFENLLAQYRREKLRIRKSIAQGTGIHQPSWYAYEPLDCFLKRKNPGQTVTEEETANLASANEEYLEQSSNEESKIDLLENFEAEKSEMENPLNSSTDEKPFRSRLTKSKKDFEPRSAKRRKVNESGAKKEETSESQLLNSTFEMLTSAAAPKKVASTSIASSTEDESRIFANFVACKLRSYSRRTKNVLQYKISNLLYQADNGHFDPYQSAFGNSPKRAHSPSSSSS